MSLTSLMRLSWLSLIITHYHSSGDGEYEGTVTAFHSRRGYLIKFDDGDAGEYSKTETREYVKRYDAGLP